MQKDRVRVSYRESKECMKTIGEIAETAFDVNVSPAHDCSLKQQCWCYHYESDRSAPSKTPTSFQKTTT